MSNGHSVYAAYHWETQKGQRVPGTSKKKVGKMMKMGAGGCTQDLTGVSQSKELCELGSEKLQPKGSTSRQGEHMSSQI